ncbi:MAG: YceI family protein [Candidatus Acidiferrales bacterium]
MQRLRAASASAHPSKNFNRALFLRPNVARSFGAQYIAAVLASFLFLASVAHAQATGPRVFNLDSAQSTIKFTLDTTLHTVEGTFKLKSGQLSFDPATGKASGQIIADATSADTVNKGRDKKMHQQILESQKYPEIIFIPQQVKGSVNPQGASQVEVSGIFRIHGQDHGTTLTVYVQPPAGDEIQVSAHFSVPYVQWGIKSPSTFLLRASDTVEIEVHASGHFVSAHR